MAEVLLFYSLPQITLSGMHPQLIAFLKSITIFHTHVRLQLN